MKNNKDRSDMNRREAMKLLAAGSATGILGLFTTPEARAESSETPSWAKGVAPVKIKSVKAITTALKVQIS
jgi:mannonate dehydratase